MLPIFFFAVCCLGFCSVAEITWWSSVLSLSEVAAAGTVVHLSRGQVIRCGKTSW